KPWALLVEIVLGRQVAAVVADLEVAVVAGGAAGGAHIADQLALADGLARADGQGQAVAVQGAVAVAVVDDEGVAVAGAGAAPLVAGPGHHAAGRCVDGGARRGADVHTLVAAGVPAGTIGVLGHRPDEGAVAHLGHAAAGHIGAPIALPDYDVSGHLAALVGLVAYGTVSGHAVQGGDCLPSTQPLL